MRWIEAARHTIPASVLDAAGGNEMLAGVLVSRGIIQFEQARAFLDPNYFQPSSPFEMQGMVEAVGLIETAISDGLKIGVWGDFDVDGQTATTVLVSALNMLGANVEFHIPVRATESHGVNIPNLAKMIDNGVQLIVTCDTGITAHDAVNYAKDRGVRFIITDHHDLPENLPSAESIINSKLFSEEHPLSSLPGVGVAYKLVEALFINQARSGELKKFLDLVALGIVADIAYLHGETRYLLQRGLQVLRTTDRLGLQILMENAGILPDFVSEEDISYSIAPRLNSLGRLGDANGIVEFLTSDHESQVRVLANRLEGLNAQRKLLSSQVFQAALSQLERNPSLLKSSALVISGPNWPAGVIGIVASRLVERFHKPTVILTLDGEGVAKGSARSIPGFDISKAIGACSDLLAGFGGHPMAAGLALEENLIDRFRECLSDQVDQQMGEEDYEPELVYDAVLDLDQISLDLVDQLDPLAPFGPGNPPLLFVSERLRLVSYSSLGRSGEHLRLMVEGQNGVQQQIVWWQGAGWDLPKGIFDLAYSARKSFFRGDVQLQVELLDFRIIEPEETDPIYTDIELIDCRRYSQPQKHMKQYVEKNSEMLIWAEGPDRQKVAGISRNDVSLSEVLVIWHSPYSLSNLRNVVNRVQPKKILLYGNNPELDEFKPFITRLSGLCKFVISRNNGITNLEDLAAAMAHSKSVVRLGLEWLENSGKINISPETEGTLILRPAKDSSKFRNYPEMSLDQIIPLLKEAKAFRNYLANCSSNQLEELFHVPQSDLTLD